MSVMNINEPKKFTVDLTGNFTKKRWIGEFAAKPLLEPMDRMAKDRLYREYLGVRCDEAGEEAKATALILSELDVRIVKFPEWWQMENFGKKSLDSNLLGTIYKEAVKVETEFLNNLEKESEKGKEVVQGKIEDLNAQAQK